MQKPRALRPYLRDRWHGVNRLVVVATEAFRNGISEAKLQSGGGTTALQALNDVLGILSLGEITCLEFDYHGNPRTKTEWASYWHLYVWLGEAFLPLIRTFDLDEVMQRFVAPNLINCVKGIKRGTQVNILIPARHRNSTLLYDYEYPGEGYERAMENSSPLLQDLSWKEGCVVEDWKPDVSTTRPQRQGPRVDINGVIIKVPVAFLIQNPWSNNTID